jgi:hypothetical protein
MDLIAGFVSRTLWYAVIANFHLDFVMYKNGPIFN